jgi:hypothetical protein
MVSATSQPLPPYDFTPWTRKILRFCIYIILQFDSHTFGQAGIYVFSVLHSCIRAGRHLCV